LDPLQRCWKLNDFLVQDIYGSTKKKDVKKI